MDILPPVYGQKPLSFRESREIQRERQEERASLGTAHHEGKASKECQEALPQQEVNPHEGAEQRKDDQGALAQATSPTTSTPAQRNTLALKRGLTRTQHLRSKLAATAC
jgi:hypothetical protein